MDTPDFYRLLIESLGEAVIAVDAQWRIFLWNRAAEIIYGWPAEEVIGKHISGILKTEYDDPFETSESAYKRLVRDSIWRGKVRQKTRDGRTIWVASTVALIRDSDGQINGMLAVNRDITESKKLGEKLNRLEQLNRVINRIYTEEEVFYLFSEGVSNLIPCSRIVFWEYVSLDAYRVLWQYHTDSKRWKPGSRKTIKNAFISALRVIGQPLIISDLQTGHYYPDGESFPNNDHALMAFPLLSGDEVTHALGIFNSVPDTYKELDLQNLLSSIEQLSLFLERKRLIETLNRQIEENRALYQKALQSEEQLRALSQVLVQTQEQEKERLSRDFHDHIGQAITALHLNLTRLAKPVEVALPNWGQTVEECLSLTSQILEQVRNLSLELHPKIMEDLGFLPALSWLVKHICEAGGVNATVSLPQVYSPMPREVELAFYRIAQEALTNVVRHANATQCWVSFKQEDGISAIEIRDNGQGFDVSPKISPSSFSSLGLRNMMARANLINATLQVHSSPGNGTIIRMEWKNEPNPHYVSG